MASEPAPIGEAQTALRAVRAMRSLLACEGWPAMQAHIVSERDKCAALVLHDDSLTHDEREKARAQFKALDALVNWPAATLQAQLDVLASVRGEDAPDGLL